MQIVEEIPSPALIRPSTSTFPRDTSRRSDYDSDDTLYVAVPKDYKEGKSVLGWALTYFPLVKKIILVHIHQPSQSIPMMGGSFPINQVDKVQAYHQLEREKVDKALDNYTPVCRIKKVKVEKLIVDNGDVAKALLELIESHGIQKLVMGAASDKRYSKDMNKPKSSLALTLHKEAQPQCDIWFVCKGNLICTREGCSNESSDSSPLSRSNTISTQSGPSKSKSFKWFGLKQPSRSHSSISSQKESIRSSFYTGGDESASDSGSITMQLGRNNEEHLLVVPSRGDVVDDPYVLTALNEQIERFPSLVLHPGSGPEEDIEVSTVYEQDNLEYDALYEKLQQALSEADKLKDEAHAQSGRRFKAEKESLAAMHRAKVMESKCSKMGQELQREKQEVEKLENCLDKILEELNETHEQRLDLEMQAKELQIKYSKEIQLRKEAEESLEREKLEVQNLREHQAEISEELLKAKVMESKCSKMGQELQREKEQVEKLENCLDKILEELNETHEQRLDLEMQAKELEIKYAKEIQLRKEAEESLQREELEVQNLREQLTWELQVAGSNNAVNNLNEKLSFQQRKLDLLLKERDNLLVEKDKALAEVKNLRQTRDISGSSQRRPSFTEFSYSEIYQATDGFAESNFIGVGGFGSVHKGFLRHTTVAIKRLDGESLQGHEEFHREIEVLSRVRHPNLVTLIGACSEAWALVYEFLPNGSLEDRLICKGNTPPLPWQVRTRICAEICSSLIFLHSNKPDSVVHGDVKPANFLLDSNFACKLGDFGISRLLAQSSTTTTLYRQTDPKGTFHYMDPEFGTTGILTRQSDIFSFGVIILRLLTGQEPHGIVRKVREALTSNLLQNIIDPSAGKWPFVQAQQLANLGIRCCEMNRRNRPDLVKDVWRVLEPMKNASSKLSILGSPEEDRRHTPSYFICPIFQEVMRDPHIAADGFTYEAEALRGWIESGHDTSPMTNLKLENDRLIPNHTLRSAIQEWLQQSNSVT